MGVSGAGGLVGAVAAPRMVRRFGPGTVLVGAFATYPASKRGRRGCCPGGDDVAEPTELSEAEGAAFWRDTLTPSANAGRGGTPGR